MGKCTTRRSCKSGYRKVKVAPRTSSPTTPHRERQPEPCGQDFDVGGDTTVEDVVQELRNLVKTVLHLRPIMTSSLLADAELVSRGRVMGDQSMTTPSNAQSQPLATHCIICTSSKESLEEKVKTGSSSSSPHDSSDLNWDRVEKYLLHQSTILTTTGKGNQVFWFCPPCVMELKALGALLRRLDLWQDKVQTATDGLRFVATKSFGILKKKLGIEGVDEEDDVPCEQKEDDDFPMPVLTPEVPFPPPRNNKTGYPRPFLVSVVEEGTDDEDKVMNDDASCSEDEDDEGSVFSSTSEATSSPAEEDYDENDDIPVITIDDDEHEEARLPHLKRSNNGILRTNGSTGASKKRVRFTLEEEESQIHGDGESVVLVEEEEDESEKDIIGTDPLSSARDIDDDVLLHADLEISPLCSDSDGEEEGEGCDSSRVKECQFCAKRFLVDADLHDHYLAQHNVLVEFTLDEGDEEAMDIDT